jgi:hypothetical protein
MRPSAGDPAVATWDTVRFDEQPKPKSPTNASSAGKRDRRAYHRQRARAIAYGCWQPYAEVGPVRDHIMRLRTSGVGINRIVTLSGVSSGTVRRLAYPTAGGPRHIRSSVAAAILSVPLNASPSARATVPVADTTRHIAALQARGYTIEEVARRLNRSPRSLKQSIQRNSVTRRTAASIRAVYMALTDNPDPEGGQRRGPDRPAPAAAAAAAANAIRY